MSLDGASSVNTIARRALTEFTGTAALVTVVVGSGIMASGLSPAVQVSTRDRSAPHLLLGEVVATAGLIVVIFALARQDRPALAPVAVVGYISAAYWFTSSTSFANPAVTLGRAVTDTFAGIAPASVPDQPGPHEQLPQVLFVCVHNAGRSQMAAAFLTHLAGDRVRVRSAGSAPADQINPAVAEAMAEVGIDLTGEIPKALTADAVQDSDVVITMGCGDACPIFPGKRYEDWALGDPAGRGVDAVRPIRDTIEARVRALISDLAPMPE